ncbi:NlpC/P60 family protein [Bacillus cereus]|nr:NlpC/P60 family protein [Bacillus cereus]
MLENSVMMGTLASTDMKENVGKSFYAYNEASFTSGKSNGGVEYTPQTILVKEKQNNGWWKIQTWEGEKWINLNGEKKYVEKPFYTYNEPSFVSAKGGGGQSFSAQEVPVIDGTTSGWLKIISYEGEKWINPNGEKKYVEKSFYTYNEPSFVSPKGGGGQSFLAQEVPVIDGTTSGWLKIISYEGEKWINPNGEKKYVEKSFYTYNEPSFVSAKGNGGQSFSAQEVPVIDGTTSGWLKIISYEGEKWINPNGERKYVEKSFYTYNEPSFVSAKGNGGQAFSAQEVLVIDGTTSGWLKIISYEGEKWINPNASEVSGVIELALKQLGKPYVFGESGPNSFDCSGFIYYVYKNNGYSISRNSVAGYWPMVIKINDPQPGDLVFLQNTYTPGPSHMGIYLGNGEFIHAGSEQTGVVRGNVFSSYNQKHFLGYGRFKK